MFGGPRPVPIDPIDTPLEGLEPEVIVPQPAQPGSASTSSGAGGPSGKQSSPKRQRAAMPSWDEIVFGARSDDDPA